MPAVEDVNWAQQQVATQTDGAHAGYCAKGVRFMMERLGWHREGMQGNGCDWLKFDEWDSKHSDEWLRVSVHPDDAPVGSIIAWDKDNNSTGLGGGREFGHVEIKGLDGDGNTKWYSDAAYNNWGGTRRHHVGDHERYAVFVRRDQLTSDEIAAIEADPASNNDQKGSYKHGAIFEGWENERRKDLTIRTDLQNIDPDKEYINAPEQLNWGEFESIFAALFDKFLEIFGFGKDKNENENSLSGAFNHHGSQTEYKDDVVNADVTNESTTTLQNSGPARTV